MHRIRTRYDRTSFRGRLLLLLVAVSLVQATVAAVTFFQLQSKPAEQRVRAQLNAALRGTAPVVDAELARASEQLQGVLDDSQLQQAIQSEDWDATEAALEARADTSTTTGMPGSLDGFEPVGTRAEQVTASGSATDQPSVALYVTDARGKVVAGDRPEGVLVSQPGVTTSRLLRDSRLVATIHASVVLDRAFLRTKVKEYVPSGIEVFVADDDVLVSTKAGHGGSRPSAMRTGMHELKIGTAQQLALVQPLLDGRVVVGAAIPQSQIDDVRKRGQTSLWGFIFLLFTLTILVSWVITKAVGDALRTFAGVARELAAGRLERRIPVTGTDEIADLSSSFNHMAEELQLRIDGLVDAEARIRRQVDLFGAALANATDIAEMLTAVCSLALEASHGTYARFWSLDEDGHYTHTACIGLRPGDTEPCGLEKAVPVRNTPVRSQGSPHWLVVPARRRDGQIIGLLTLVSTGADFAADDVRIAERIAVQAAVAMENARLHERLREQATRDGLTGLPNHRSLQDELTVQLERAQQSGSPLGICMLDIDNFKRVNDTYGHPVGDEAIKAIGRALQQGMGGVGMVGRYGGEEFVVILPGCDASTSCRIADRLREDIMRIEVPLADGGVLRVTSSFGVANVDQQDGVPVDNAGLLGQADVGLYNAKRTGKNRVTLAGPTTTVIEMDEAERERLAARERGAAAEAAAETASGSGGSATPGPLELDLPDDGFEDPFDLAA